MHSSTCILTAVASLIAPTLAAPRPQYQLPCNSYPAKTAYAVTAQESNVAGPPVVGDYSVVGAQGGNSLSAGSTYTTSVTVTVGVDLGLDFAAIAGSAGISASVATTEASGTSNGVSVNCPAGAWTCGLSITPAMIRVTGIMTVTPQPVCSTDSYDSPFTMLFPVKNADHLVGGLASACTCHNMVGWADPGALGLACPADCPE